MKSVEGYTPQDAGGPNEGPWAGAPVAGPSPEASPETDSKVRAAEDALEVALAEVSRVEDELRSMEQVRDRLRVQLQQASSEADALIAQVAESYARERERLEAELRSVQERASGLEQIRETRINKTEVPSTAFAQNVDAEPRPVFAVAPVPAAPETDTQEPTDPVPAVIAAEQPADSRRGDRKSRKRPDGVGEAEDSAYEDHWYQVLKRDNSLGAERS